MTPIFLLVSGLRHSCVSTQTLTHRASFSNSKQTGMESKYILGHQAGSRLFGQERLLVSLVFLDGETSLPATVSVVHHRKQQNDVEDPNQSQTDPNDGVQHQVVYPLEGRVEGGVRRPDCDVQGILGGS